MSSGFSVNVKSNADNVVMDFLSAASEMPDATVRALNKIGDQTKVAASREVRAAGYNLKASVIKKGMSVKRATKSSLKVTVIASGKPVPLINYGARQTGTGVSVSVLKGRKVIAGAFIATMPSGHKGVFVREGNAKATKVARGGKTAWHALPIKELFGPSVPDGLANKAVQNRLQQMVVDKFPALLAHEQAWLRRRVGR